MDNQEETATGSSPDEAKRQKGVLAVLEGLRTQIQIVLFIIVGILAAQGLIQDTVYNDIRDLLLVGMGAAAHAKLNRNSNG